MACLYRNAKCMFDKVPAKAAFFFNLGKADVSKCSRCSNIRNGAVVVNKIGLANNPTCMNSSDSLSLDRFVPDSACPPLPTTPSLNIEMKMYGNTLI